MKFYNRVNELSIIRENEKQSYDSAMFMVLTGRRRVGKTSLVTKAMEGKEYAYLFVSKSSESLLCQNFQRELEQQIGLTVYGEITRFKDLFEVIMREAQKRHLTIVLDEFQTLYKINPTIFSEIQDIWDRFKQNAKIHLIVSGSIQTLMKRIFDDKSEPLYGRPTSKLVLRPFTTAVIKEILHDANPNYTPDDLLCLYMITGGVAKYIELLIDAKCYTKEKMLNYICRQDSYFITEGKDLLNQEFSSEHGTYFSILQIIASGKTKRSEIDSALQKDVGTFLQNLESKYELIRRKKPLLAKQNSKVSTYDIRDNFLRFWFRFVYRYQSAIELKAYGRLREFILRDYRMFSGKALESYFAKKLSESGEWTRMGSWWDRKGENEIDLIAVDEFGKRILFCEVKRNAAKISAGTLHGKAAVFLRAHANYAAFTPAYRALSLSEM